MPLNQTPPGPGSAWLAEHVGQSRLQAPDGAKVPTAWRSFTFWKPSRSALISRLAAWVAANYDALHGDVLGEEQERFETPEPHELVSVTRHLIAPIRLLGTSEQQELVPALSRAGQLSCQLFSEPSAGSDIATLATRA